MDIDLTGKRAIVCGASKGIGKACAFEIAALGASVTLVARSQQALEAISLELDTSKGQTHRVLVADFSNSEALESIVHAHVEEYGPFHVLVNNSGGPPAGHVHTAKQGAFIGAFTQHLIGNQIMVQAVLEGMKNARYGRIINIISTSVKQPIAGLGVSNTIRGAVASWAKTLAAEVGPYGITVNNLLPGYTETDRLMEVLKAKAEAQNIALEDLIEAEKQSIPARRFGQPHELGQAVAFLASPAAAYINGTNVTVDGGRTQCL